MAKAPATRKTRERSPRRVNRAQSAVNRVDSQLNSTVTTLNVDAAFKSHAMIKLLGDHWAQLNTACYHLATFMPILHNADDVETVSNILDMRVNKAIEFIKTQKDLLDTLEAEAGMNGEFDEVNSLTTKMKITSRLGVQVFAMLQAADTLLNQADKLWLTNHMSDAAHTNFIAKINKEARAVCVNIRQQHQRLLKQLQAKRNSPNVKENEEVLKQAGVDLDTGETAEPAKIDDLTLENKPLEQTSDKSEDAVVAAE